MAGPGDVYVDFSEDEPRRIVPHIPVLPNLQADPGVELPFTATLFEGNGLAVSIVSPLHIYSTGLSLSIQWDLHRDAQDFDAIQPVLHNLWRARRTDTPTDLLPTIEIDYGNDRVLSTQRVRPDEQDKPPPSILLCCSTPTPRG
jgi:hypothetical protein